VRPDPPGGAAIRLRAPQAADLARLLEWRSDAENQRLLMWRTGATGVDDIAAWVARRTEDPDGWFAIVASAKDEAIGFIQMTHIDQVDGHAELGLMIAPEIRGRGAGARALALAEDEARRRGLAKLVIEVLADNAGALRFWAARAFRRIGLLRAHHRRGGGRHDVVLMEKALDTAPGDWARVADSPGSSNLPGPGPSFALPPIANEAAAVAAMAADPEVRTLRDRLFDLMGKHRYSYNWTWFGRPIIQLPQDVLAMQALILAEQPDLIIETGVAHGGSLVFSASMLELLGGAGRVVGVDIDIRPHNRRAIEAHPLAHRIALIQGSSVDDSVAAAVREHARRARRVMVCLDSNHTHDHVARELALYAPLVTPGQHLVVFDTAIDDLPASAFPDRPWGPGNSPKSAVRDFLARNPSFVVDRELEARLLFTVAPEGYLKRVA
jgi:cephalosporin hydroxylase/RimJ/RimL family protein N-acetyltransferase